MIYDCERVSESSQHGHVLFSNFTQVFGGRRRVTGKFGATRDEFLSRYKSKEI